MGFFRRDTSEAGRSKQRQMFMAARLCAVIYLIFVIARLIRITAAGEAEMSPVVAIAIIVAMSLVSVFVIVVTFIDFIKFYKELKAAKERENCTPPQSGENGETVMPALDVPEDEKGEAEQEEAAAPNETGEAAEDLDAGDYYGEDGAEEPEDEPEYDEDEDDE